MSDVKVPFGADNEDNAVLLLAAAQDLGLEPSVVKVTNGAFVVPEEVHEKAFGKSDDSKATKKTAAKKTASTKSQE